MRPKGRLHDAKLITTHQCQRPCLVCLRCLSRAPYNTRFCDHKAEKVQMPSAFQHLQELVFDHP